MGELGTRCTTERVHVGNSPPKVARTALLPDGQFNYYRMRRDVFDAYQRTLAAALAGAPALSA
jgi:hypothetical protein